MGFIVSFFLVSCSSLFFTFSLKERRISHNLIYFFLILISQLIISFEILSLLKSIHPAGVLLCNVLFLPVAMGVWLAREKFVPDFSRIKNTVSQVIFTIKSDKILLFLAVLFFFCSLITLFFVIFVPTNSIDALIYKLARVGFWVQNNSLEHFTTSSIRQVIFPINWELMLLWPMVFFKKDYLSIFPAFFSYYGCLVVVGAFLRSLNLSWKRTLWVILILGSLPTIILEASSVQSDLFIGFLLFSSFYLFYFSVKNNEKLSAIFSAIAYAIALGAKSTAILFIPAFLTVYLAICIKERGKDFYKPFLEFSIFLIAGFLLLSAYNYALNYFSFGNILGPRSAIEQHVSPGIGSFVPSALLYAVYLMDFSGFGFIKNINPDIVNGISSFLDILGYKLSDGVCIGEFNGLNYMIHENFSSFGLLGYILIIPFSVFAVAKMSISRGRSFYLRCCGLFLVLFLLILILAMGFSVWCIRYFATAIVLCSPVLAFSYFKKNHLFKILVFLIACFNYLALPLYSDQKPFFEIAKIAQKSQNFREFRRDIRLRRDMDFSSYYKMYYLLGYLRHVPDYSGIGVVFSEYDPLYPLFEENPTWKLFPVRYEKLLAERKFEDLDYLVLAGTKQNTCPLKDTVNYNYYPDYENKTIRFSKTDSKTAKTFYANRDNIIIFSGKPSKMANILDDSVISEHYKLTKKIILKYSDNKKNGLFRIYKKVLYQFK